LVTAVEELQKPRKSYNNVTQYDRLRQSTKVERLEQCDCTKQQQNNQSVTAQSAVVQLLETGEGRGEESRLYEARRLIAVRRNRCLKMADRERSESRTSRFTKFKTVL
jgi:hypothetical protein